jgi:maltose O-acetyltransferase
MLHILKGLKGYIRLAIRQWWYIFYYGFALYLPASFRFQPLGRLGKKLRAMACRRLFRSCGREVNIEHGAYFDSGWELEIGDYSSLGINCSVPYDLKIGKHVMMAPDVKILGQNHQFDDVEVPMRLQGTTELPPVQIEDDVWIGARATIVPAVRIGTGAIVGACAVVTKDVPPYAICAGNPARVIRYRTEKALSRAADNSDRHAVNIVSKVGSSNLDR